MLIKIEQRKYIQDFIDFTGSFLLTEKVTINELNLVIANLKILSERIAEFGDTAIIGNGSYTVDGVRSCDKDVGCKMSSGTFDRALERRDYIISGKKNR